MAMSMEELFYGANEPVYFGDYGRETAARQAAVPGFRSRRVELISFDLMVPMCCARCKDQVQEALFALGSVREVLCDARSQRVTVTGCLDPALALKQVRRVKNGATFWSNIASSTYSAHRYEVSSHQKQHRVAYQDNRDRMSYVQSEAREQRSWPGQCNRPSASDRYTRIFCPAYRDSAQTHYMSLNPMIATVEERFH